MNAVPSKTMFLAIGRKRFQVASFKDASEQYCKARDISGLGGSEFPTVQIVDENGDPIARISYNGRVWPPVEFEPGLTPIYDNRTIS